MRFRGEIRFDQLNPTVKLRKLAARKLLYASRRGDPVQTILVDEELRAIAGADCLSVLREFCVKAAQAPIATIPNWEWFARSAAQLMLT